MRRYWLHNLSPQLQEGDELFLEGSSYHHIVEVCCQHKRALFEILGEFTPIYLVELQEIQAPKKRVRVRIKDLRKKAQRPLPHLYLALCVPQFKKMDFILQKSVELGVKALYLVFSDYSFVKKGLPEGKKDRWQRVIASACEQCGRTDPLELYAPQPLAHLLECFSSHSNDATSCKALFAYEGQGGLSLKTQLQELRQNAPVSLQSFWLFVGSEGGFSEREVMAFKARGLEPVSLGEQVLRVETACMVLLSVIKYEWGLWK